MVHLKQALALAAAALTFSAAQAQAQQPLAFVACPILRDTATVPCWLVEYEGELYSIDGQGEAAADPPALGHQALIEGTPTEARRCGGKVMTNLRISIRPERDLSCSTILPASDAFQIAETRGPALSNARAVAGAAPATPPLEGSQKFEVFFDFDWQTPQRDTEVLMQAAAYAKANPKAELRVQGYRAAVKLTGGRVLDEEDGIDTRRAQAIGQTLAALGVDMPILVVDNPAPDLGDHTRRRAVIEVVMSGSDDHAEH